MIAKSRQAVPRIPFIKISLINTFRPTVPCCPAFSSPCYTFALYNKKPCWRAGEGASIWRALLFGTCLTMFKNQQRRVYSGGAKNRAMGYYLGGGLPFLQPGGSLAVPGMDLGGICHGTLAVPAMQLVGTCHAACRYLPCSAGVPSMQLGSCRDAGLENLST